MSKLVWNRDITECKRFAYDTARIRHGNTYDVEYTLWQAMNEQGPPWKTIGGYGRLRSLKREAQCIADAVAASAEVSDE